MAFYHWLGPAMKGWQTGRNEKEEREMESTLKKIKMQQLLDSMAADKTRLGWEGEEFGQKKKSWAAEDAKNTYLADYYGDGGAARKKDANDIENQLLERTVKKNEVDRIPTLNKQHDDKYAVDLGISNENLKQERVDSKYAERKILSELEKNSRIGASSLTKTPRQPPIPEPPADEKAEMSKLIEAGLVQQMKGFDKFAELYPELAKQTKYISGGETEGGVNLPLLGNIGGKTKPKYFNMKQYINDRNLTTKTTIANGRARVDREIEALEKELSGPALKAVHNGSGGATQSAVQPAPQQNPAFKPLPDGSGRFKQNGFWGNISDTFSTDNVPAKNFVYETLAAARSGQMTQRDAMERYVQLQSIMPSIGRPGDKRDIIEAMQLLEQIIRSSGR